MRFSAINPNDFPGRVRSPANKDARSPSVNEDNGGRVVLIRFVVKV